MSTEQTSRVTIYCDRCGDDREFTRELREQVVPVRGEDIAVQAPMLVCSECGSMQPDLQAGPDSIKLANDEYRRRHRLLRSDEIRRIREQYDLSHEAFAAVLGMSPATLYRYEGGAVQDQLQDGAIFACDDPATMVRLVQRHPEVLSPLQKKRFEEALARLTSRRAAEAFG
jgi:putative zinc finger/helix-turn-helix YgiT family protein